MNKKLFFSIILSIVAGFTLATYLFLPHVEVEDTLYTISEADFKELNDSPSDCDAIQRSSFLNELDVIDLSDKQKSAYLNHEVSSNQSSELHIFGVYSGTPVIQVDKTDVPTTLFLASAEFTLWSVQLDEHAQVNKIYISGGVKEIRLTKKAALDSISKFKHLFLNKPALDIEVIKINRDSMCRTYGYRWQPDEKGQFRSFINSVRQKTQLIERSFQGLYSFNTSHDPFKVLAKQDPRQHQTSETVSTANATDYPEPIGNADALMDFIEALISQNIIPDSLPTTNHGSEGRLMKFSPPFTSNIPKIKIENDGVLKCNGSESVLIEGDNRPNNVDCSWGNQIIYGGAGKDLIEDSWGNDIFYGGKGNDVIDAGWGSDILIFNKGWGNDVVDKTCHHSKYHQGSTIGATAHHYKWEYTNFIVFGPDIYPKDIVWQKNKLINTRTGDSIDFKNRCFNFVYVSEKEET